jgi:preprotein translocase subunit SecF
VSRLTDLGGRLQSGETSFNIVGNRKKFFIVSLILVAISGIGLGARGLDRGVEFKGGTVFQTKAQGLSVADVRGAVEDAGAKEPKVQKIGTDSVRVEISATTLAEADPVKQALSKKLGIPAEDITEQTVGSSWGSDITHKAVKSLIIFLALLAIYLGVVFEWKLAVGALVALIHDVLITVGIYAVVGFTVSPATVIGLLTILGYSLYDTVVVYDKLKENTANLTNSNRYTYSGAANLAVNQTLIRSINTSVIALLPVAGLLFVGAGLLGAGVLKDLALVLFVGMAVGAYSSIFIATPIAAAMKEREPEMQALAKRVAQRQAAGKDRAAAAAAAEGEGSDGAAPAGKAATVTRPAGPPPGERVQPKRGGARATRRPGQK